MALDHVRAYFTSAHFPPLDLTQTTTGLYLTRWVTHFCAPVFIFLAGISAFLVSKRCTKAELSRFLLTRGLWLIVIEFTVVVWSWTFDITYPYGLIMQVIWVIGLSMVIMAALVRLPVRVVGAFGVLLIAGHNLLDPIAPASFGSLAVLWNILHVPGEVPFGLVAYPLIPWVGVMALGYAMGGIFEMEPARRRRILTTLGLSMIGAFLVLRWFDVYGDPQQWSPQSSAWFTVLSYFKVSKYPPSLFYVLITLGPAMLLLAALENARGRIADVFATFGRVPFFFYTLHIALAHFLAGLVGLWAGFGTAILRGYFFTYPEEWGYGLPGVYLAWLVVILILYPACRWFAALKRRRRDWWLSYL
jgi:uncharacterized membrane protein